MMNATHGPSGALAGLASLWAGYRLGVPVEMTTGTAWVAACTAGALLPDSDHPSSNVARLWGPLTSIPAGILGRWAGGHRAGTHDVSKGAPLLFGFVLMVGAFLPWARLGVVALLVGLTLLGFAGLIPGRLENNRLLNLLASWGVAWAITPPEGWPLPVVLAIGLGVALGVLVGIAGDACTLSGVPWKGRDVHLLPRPLRIRTGKTAELVIFRLPILAGIVFMLVALNGALVPA
jgi:LexA-binding, inner membrane-associated putative hydrolase